MMRSVFIPDTSPGRARREGYGLSVRVVSDPLQRRTAISTGSFGWSGDGQHNRHCSQYRRKFPEEQWETYASVITSKAANGYHLKTGQRITTVETGVFYSVVFESSKQFSIVSWNRV